MEYFPDATTVRLKGPHGKYLWAEDDHYRTAQHRENRNAKASWRVERGSDADGNKTVRLKSCYDTYLTADDRYHKNLSVLGCAGKKVVQMRSENVDSCRKFDWEPVIDGPFLKLKTCYGTFLRGNSCFPPWCNSVSHDLPRHENHQTWLYWKVEIVQIPKTIPLEILHLSSLERKGSKDSYHVSSLERTGSKASYHVSSLERTGSKASYNGSSLERKGSNDPYYASSLGKKGSKDSYKVERRSRTDKKSLSATR